MQKAEWIPFHCIFLIFVISFYFFLCHSWGGFILDADKFFLLEHIHFPYFNVLRLFFWFFILTLLSQNSGIQLRTHFYIFYFCFMRSRNKESLKMKHLYLFIIFENMINTTQVVTLRICFVPLFPCFTLSLITSEHRRFHIRKISLFFIRRTPLHSKRFTEVFST